ncbi:MAG: Gx transporter family protein [Lachnospiraceae bacterium]|nr:Gx transporter family protein [Lachnospiraceae bacterium]
MKSKKLSFLGLFLTAALILSYIETLIPFFYGIPGLKLGLANAMVMLLLYIYGVKDCILVNIIRILIVGFFFGNAFSIIYSLVGALFSVIIMVILKKTDKFDLAVVSICGGMAHNTGQILIASVFFGTPYLLYYLPVLLLSGFICGGVIGIISKGLVTRLKVLLTNG